MKISLKKRRAARRSDPVTSQEAVREYGKGWDSLNNRALRVHYDADRLNPGHGLTNFQAEQAAAAIGGLGKSPWKRISELHTRYNPPLITNALHPNGVKVTRKGEFSTDVEVFVITDAGRARINEMIGVLV